MNLFLTHVSGSTVYVNWSVDDLGGLSVTEMLLEWKNDNEVINRIEKSWLIRKKLKKFNVFI